MSQENTTEDDLILQQAPLTESAAASGHRVIRMLLPFLVALLLISATVWSLGVFGLTTYQTYFSIPEEVVVPEVTNLEIKEAYEAIEKAGLKLQVHESRYDKKVKKRIVLSQDPAGGKMVRQGRTILVVVSLGPELMAVPKVTGDSLRTAKIALSNSKLRLGKVTFEEAAYGQDEEVVKQNPAAGKDVPRGQEVHLTVRRGWH